MNQLIKTTQSKSGDIIVSGRELHEFLEVDTPFRKWFPRMVEYGFVEGADYTPDIFVHPRNKQETTDYLLKLDMAKEIAMIQRTEKGKQARQYFIQIEKLWNSPEAIMKRALEYADRKMIELQTRLDKQQPLVAFAETCMTSDKSLLVREVAKLCSKNGIITGERRLWQKLRDWKLVFSNKNEPYQEYIDRGYFEITQGVKENSKGAFTWLTMRVTPKGQIYIINRLKKEQAAKEAI